MVHLGWGDPERAFALAHWRAQLDLRPLLAELWRALGGGALEGDALERALRGDGAYPRRGSALRADAAGARRARASPSTPRRRPGAPADVPRAAGSARTDLDRSPAHRAYAARLAAVERHLGGGGSPGAAGTAADAG